MWDSSQLRDRGHCSAGFLEKISESAYSGSRRSKCGRARFLGGGSWAPGGRSGVGFSVWRDRRSRFGRGAVCNHRNQRVSIMSVANAADRRFVAGITYNFI